MANGVLIVFIAVFVLQIGTGKDIRWIKNSNWNNVDNWSLGRLPCKGDIASFSQVTAQNGQRPMIYFNTNSTVRKLVLPRNGKIVLKPSITIRLAVNESCEISSNTIPMVATGGEMNNFVGVRANKWECPENWVADDGSSITHAPCGSDVPVFPSDSAFSFITSEMEKISVESILLRDERPPNFDPYDDELLLNLSINTECQNNSSLCPCIEVDNDCNILASTALPTTGLSTVIATTAALSSTVVSTATATSMPTTALSSTALPTGLSTIMVTTTALSSTGASTATAPPTLTTALSSSMAPSTSLYTPGNVGVTGTVSVPLLHTSGPIEPVATAGIENNDDNGNNIVMIGAIVGVILLLLILAIIFIVIIIIVRRRRYKETKHTHLEEDDHNHTFATKESGTAAYDNPTYECNLSIHSTDIENLENPLF